MAMPGVDPERSDDLSVDDLRDVWPLLSNEDRAEGFRILPRTMAEEFLLECSARDQGQLILALPPNERRSWMRFLPPDDVADLLQEAPAPEREALMALLDGPAKKEVTALLAYAEDEAGGLMNPRYVRLRPDMSVDEAISYLRKQARQHLETVYYLYVVGEGQRLLGVVSLRELLKAQPDKKVREVMRTDLVWVTEDQDQESVSRLFALHDLVAIPVLDAEGRMKGIVTVDDIVDVVHEEATEDIQKFGGMAALEAPYLTVAFSRMVKKRAGWLLVLFLGEMLTATAMAHFEDQIARAVVLTLFVPLIISSGGNSGSQASTLVVRAMALEEVLLRDWWRVLRRELASGLVLGGLLGTLGFLRIVLWQWIKPVYGEHYMLIAFIVSGSLLGVVLFGTVVGSLLPFLFRRLGFDPASASAPFVATLVDVTGLLIYFGMASVVLRGTLL
jgi:magnesium transporter